jgi:Catalytic LigB subunit of aromatic ring-opening dioxygenase
LAVLCSVIATSHSPFLFIRGEQWGPIRELRNRSGRYAPGTPVDPVDENVAKHARCISALGELRRQLDSARPDVLIIFGDDQDEQFSLATMPSLAVFAGEEFAGYRISRFEGVPLPGTARAERPKTSEHWASVRGHPGLGRHLVTGLVRNGFDPAFMLTLPDQDEGMSHAFMRPLHCLRPACDLPVVPVFVNCFYGPQPTAARCYQVGRAVRELIGSWPEDLRVAVIGSGGLWHTPLDPGATIDERFDADILAAVRAGGARAMAAVFDQGLEVSNPKASRSSEAGGAGTGGAGTGGTGTGGTGTGGTGTGGTGTGGTGTGGTGMVLGYGSGTGETRNWVAAAAVADGIPGTVVDSVPIWASPIGVAFAYWPLDVLQEVSRA